MTISIARTRAHRNARPVQFSLMTALTVWSERRTLRQMDANRLKDMGISPADAAAEAARPFWDLPDRKDC